MEESLFRILLRKSESETLDFKEGQYAFAEGCDIEKGELLKDILAFANSWKETDAFILIGVSEKDGRASGLVRVLNHLPDHSLQQFVNTRTNRPITFNVEAITVDGLELDVIRISRIQKRPIFLAKDFGRVSKGVVYIRRGSSTNIAGADEIAEMGRADSSAAILQSCPILKVEFADPSKRVRFGTEYQCTSFTLVDPPSPPREQAHILPYFDLSIGEPKLSDWIEYLKELKFWQPLGLWIENSSATSAANVRCELRIPQEKGLSIVSGADGPKEPRQFHTIFDREPSLTIVHEAGDYVSAMEVPRLQPRAEYWSDGVFYVGATANVSSECTLRIFADNLPNPLEQSLRLAVNAVQRTYKNQEVYELKKRAED